MCIQLGSGAEYYIKTGRGRAITREEAREIIRKATAQDFKCPDCGSQDMEILSGNDVMIREIECS